MRKSQAGEDLARGRKYSRCKGPEVRRGLSLRNRRKASGLEGVRGKWGRQDLDFLSLYLVICYVIVLFDPCMVLIRGGP